MWEPINRENVAERQRRRTFFALVFLALALALTLALSLAVLRGRQTVLRIRDWESGEIYLEAAAGPGDKLHFGWLHSLEKIPWNEYYHVDENLNLVLDSISFPAFGAGIPENKGKVCRIENGLIHMEEIGQVFEQFLWLNSRYTQEITLNDRFLTRGSELPEHRKLILLIERRGFHVL